jgi:hypothetical protein
VQGRSRGSGSLLVVGFFRAVEQDYEEQERRELGEGINLVQVPTSTCQPFEETHMFLSPPSIYFALITFFVVDLLSVWLMFAALVFF